MSLDEPEADVLHLVAKELERRDASLHPDLAESALVAAQGLTTVTKRVSDHLLGGPCAICERRLSSAWRIACPSAAVVQEASGWPLESAMSQALATHASTCSELDCAGYLRPVEGGAIARAAARRAAHWRERLRGLGASAAERLVLLPTHGDLILNHATADLPPTIEIDDGETRVVVFVERGRLQAEAGPVSAAYQAAGLDGTLAVELLVEGRSVASATIVLSVQPNGLLGGRAVFLDPAGDLIVGPAEFDLVVRPGGTQR